jgi:hypothetical protein
MEPTISEQAIACAPSNGAANAIPKIKRSQTKSQKRAKKAILPPSAHAVDYEEGVAKSLLLLLRDSPERLPEVLPAVDIASFELEPCRRVIEAIRTAASVGRLNTETVNAVVRVGHEHDDVDHASAPATALLTGSLEDVISPQDAEFHIRRIVLSMPEVLEAACNRRSVSSSLDTLHNFGLISLSNSSPTTIAPLKPKTLSGLPVVRVELANRAEVTDTAEARLATEFFVRDGRLVSVAMGPIGPVIVPATKERVADRLERLCAFVEPAKDEHGGYTMQPIPCPGWLPQVMVHKQVWPSVRELRGIARGPFIRPDGTIGGTRSGYDQATGILVITDQDWSCVNHNPTAKDVSAAVDALLDVIKDFPFETASVEPVNPRNDTGRSVWVAAVLTLVGRPAFVGPSPLFLLDATTAGSGKSMLARLLSLIARGAEPPLAGMPQHSAELKKAMTAALDRGDDLHVFDNCVGMIGNDVLDLLLTTTNFQDRRLGTNETIVAENRIMLVATSNNACVGADTARRTLTLRLRPEVDHPEEQEFDRSPTSYALKHRPRLLASALTILRWHLMHDLDSAPRAKPFGSFESWSDVIRLAVIRAGLADPLASQERVRQIDDGSRLRGSFLECWEAWNPGFVGTARSLVSMLFDTRPDKRFIDETDEAEKLRSIVMDLTNCTARTAGSAEARKLGYIIRSIRGRLFGGRSIDVANDTKEGNAWCLTLPPGRQEQIEAMKAEQVAEDCDDEAVVFEDPFPR